MSKFWRRGGKLLVCNVSEQSSEQPGEPCEVCDADTTPATVSLQISGVEDDFCDCSGFAGTFVLEQVEGSPCEWQLNVAYLTADCFPISAGRYDQLNASVTDDGMGNTIYYLEVLDTLSAHKLTFSKTVSGGDRNDCLSQWNSGGWSVGDGMMVDCNAAGISYTISAAA